MKRRETFNLKAFNKDLKYIRQQEELDFSYLTEFVPQEFIQAVKPFVKAEEAFSLWGKVQAVSKRMAPEVMEIIEPAIRAFKSSVMAYKMKRVKKGFGAYFWGALQGVFAVEQRKRVRENMFNWLEIN
ncbi:hypothetical protein MUN89_17870 [Halobacillus salinarum]|uniref:Transposase n=1 Tax=Halobacillus salinarum TaxID=2932257 RepID=A0ABY4EIA7_9BACI|nr:hypothetical protein [Halobacillus salinarum]UOQ43730.1 hypothetical protein MUN89_17870 [Halobacillus salinarum]